MKLRDNLPLLEENLKRIRDNELYSPTYFRDVELAKPFIVELSRINLVSSGKIDDISLQSAIRKFEDHYVRDVYKGIFLSDGTSDILDKIKNSNEENDEMLKTICDALSDIIFITRISDFERKVNQMSFYISQSNVERPFTFQKCIFFIIRKAEIYEGLIKDIVYTIELQNEDLIPAEAYCRPKMKFFLPLKDFSYVDIVRIDVKLILTDARIIEYSVKLNKKVDL